MMRTYKKKIENGLDSLEMFIDNDVLAEFEPDPDIDLDFLTIKEEFIAAAAVAPNLLAACEMLQPLAIKHAPHGIDEDYWNDCFEKLELAVAEAKKA